MATERNENEFGGRYLIQDQDHMSEIVAAREAAKKPVTGTPSGGWVKPEAQASQRETTKAR